MKLAFVPKLLKNFYFVFTFIFFVWMVFFDANNLRFQLERSHKLNKLEKEKHFYENNISQVETEREELLSNDKLLEKFAREKYLMKKPHEDVYVVTRQ